MRRISRYSASFGDQRDGNSASKSSWNLASIPGQRILKKQPFLSSALSLSFAALVVAEDVEDDFDGDVDGAEVTVHYEP